MANHCHTAGAIHRKDPTLARACIPKDTHPVTVRFQTASHSSPTDLALRANPFPEVTDLICRLPLPTLFYRLEAVHLGDLLRIWVRSGTKIILPPSDFQGPAKAHRMPQEPWHFSRSTSLSPVEPFPGSPSLKKKRQLFSGLSLTSPSSFALPRRTNTRYVLLHIQVREY